MPLATLAAEAAVPWDDIFQRWIHAGERELQRSTDRLAAFDHVGLFDRGVRRHDVKVVCQPKGKGRGERLSERWRRIGKRVVVERADREAVDAGRCAEDARFA